MNMVTLNTLISKAMTLQNANPHGDTIKKHHGKQNHTKPISVGRHNNNNNFWISGRPEFDTIMTYMTHNMTPQ